MNPEPVDVPGGVSQLDLLDARRQQSLRQGRERIGAPRSEPETMGSP